MHGASTQRWLGSLHAALGWRSVLSRVGGAVHQESGALDLTGAVKGDQADVGVRERLGAVRDLGQDLLGVGASEHGQLVHGPVPVGATNKLVLSENICSFVCNFLNLMGVERITIIIYTEGMHIL